MRHSAWLTRCDIGVIMRFQTVASLLFVLLAACGGETDEDKQPSPLSTSSSSSGQPASTSGGAPITQAGPVVWSATASGCGDFYAYVADSTETKYLLIRSKRDGIGISKAGDKATVDLATSDKVSVGIDVFPRAGGGDVYCNDAVSAETPKKTEQWLAKSGSVEIELLSYKGEQDFNVTITLKGVSVTKSDGTQLAIPDTKYENLHVGWLPG